MDESETIARDLFGEAVIPAKPRRRGRLIAPIASPETVEPPAEVIAVVPAAVRLRLPAQLAVEGSIKANPLRQIARKAGLYEGTLEPVEIKRVAGFLFCPNIQYFFFLL